MLGQVFGVLGLWYAWTGTISALRPIILKYGVTPLPPLRPRLLDATALTFSPADIARTLTTNIQSLRFVRSPSGHISWYEVTTSERERIMFDARTGSTISPWNELSLQQEINLWLAGTPWSLKSKPVLMTEFDEHYRKGEQPYYKATLLGPGDYEVYFSAQTGHFLAAHSRTSRLLRWAGMALHAWGIKALRPYDRWKRLLSPAILGMPLFALAVTALGLKLSDGFNSDLANLSWEAKQWHSLLGSYVLFILMFLSVTGSGAMLIPLVNKYATPVLPPTETDLSRFVLPLSHAAGLAQKMHPGIGLTGARLHSMDQSAWYEFEFADGSLIALSAIDGKRRPLFATPEEITAHANRWLLSTAFSVQSTVLQTSHDTLYRQGELPVYRVELNGPKKLRLYLSARDGQLAGRVNRITRLERLMEHWLYESHSLDFRFLSGRDGLRAALLILFFTLPLGLCVILGFSA
jgi:hypothetical protein